MSKGRKEVQPPDVAAVTRVIETADELTPPSFAACFTAVHGRLPDPGELDALTRSGSTWTRARSGSSASGTRSCASHAARSTARAARSLSLRPAARAPLPAPRVRVAVHDAARHALHAVVALASLEPRALHRRLGTSTSTSPPGTSTAWYALNVLRASPRTSSRCILGTRRRSSSSPSSTGTPTRRLRASAARAACAIEPVSQLRAASIRPTLTILAKPWRPSRGVAAACASIQHPPCLHPSVAWVRSGTAARVWASCRLVGPRNRARGCRAPEPSPPALVWEEMRLPGPERQAARAEREAEHQMTREYDNEETAARRTAAARGGISALRHPEHKAAGSRVSELAPSCQERRSSVQPRRAASCDGGSPESEGEESSIRLGKAPVAPKGTRRRTNLLLSGLRENAR